MERLPERDPPRTQTRDSIQDPQWFWNEMHTLTSRPFLWEAVVWLSRSESHLCGQWFKCSQIQSYIKTLLQHSELNSCKSQNNLYWSKWLYYQTEITEYWKGSRVLTATFWRIYSFAIDWLVLVALCWAFGVFVDLPTPTLWNNFGACYKDLPFVEWIYHCFFILFFTL